MVQSTSSLCEQVITNLKSQASEAIKKVWLSEVDQKAVLDILGGISFNPFEGLQTEYQQEKFHEENFNYLVGEGLALAPHMHTFFSYSNLNWDEATYDRNLCHVSLGDVWCRREQA